MPRVIDEPKQTSISRLYKDMFLIDNEYTGTHSIEYGDLLDSIASAIGTFPLITEVYPRTGATELSSTWLSTISTSGPALTPSEDKVYVLKINSTTYRTGDQFRWSGSAYSNINGNIKAITDAEIDEIFV